MANKICLGCMEWYSDKDSVCPYCGYEEGTLPEFSYYLTPGTVLEGKYVVGKALGSGGFGITYIGYNAVLEQKIAIKEYLPPEFSTRSPGENNVTVFSGDKTEQFNAGVEKFIEEARRLAKFKHTPGIVSIYDSFAANQTAYIVMQYLDGETLKEKVNRDGPLDIDTALNIMLPVVSALKEVHKVNILHRDVAPDNIFLTRYGDVKLFDFGAARYATTTRHSRSLSVIVKPGYTPPEQYRSRGDQGSWTDVYACAATLYYMVTGVVPEESMDREEKDDLLPPSKLGVKLPKNKENAIMNALNLRIEDRTQDMEAFEADLRTNEEVKRKKNHIKKMDIGKWPLWMKIVSGAAAAAVVALIVLIATGVIDVKRILPGADSGLEDGSVYVPNVVNYNLAEAEVRIDDARLIEQITDKQNSDVIPKDMVLSQNISDGTIVPEGAVLEITVSAGGEIVYIPDVTGMSHDEAVAALQELGLYVDTEETESELAEGYVVSQSADEGTGIEKGTSITLTISKGDPEYDTDKETEVPELVGEDWDSARDKIKSAKLYIYKQSAEYSESIPKGQIMSQEIEAGKKVNVGSSVGVVISLGIKTTYVPDVQYKTLEEAETSLGDSNLQLEIEYEDSDTVAKNHVVRQSIEAGTEVEMQTVITIWISNGNTAAENAPVVNNRQTSESTEGAEDATTPSQEVKPENTASQKATTQSTSKNSDSKKSKTKKKTTENTTEKTTEAETQKTTQAATEKTTERTTEATTEKTTQATTEKTTQATTEKTTQATTESVQAKVSVPTLTGKTESAAKSSISSAGLTAGTVSYQHSTSVSNGYVISQSLSAGTSVEKGSTVNIVVCNNSTYTEYRYRTKSTTTSTTSSSMSGWTLTDTKTTYGNWGSWSGYSTTAVSKNDTTDVETKQETTYPDNPGSYSYSTSFILSVVGNGQVYDTVKWYQQFADEQWNRGLDIDGKYGYYTCAFVKDFQRQYGLTVDGAIGPNTTSKMLEVWRQSKATTTTYYRYRTRTVTTTYYFEKWSAWSSWSTTYQSSSSTKEVETRQSYVY